MNCNAMILLTHSLACVHRTGLDSIVASMLPQSGAAALENVQNYIFCGLVQRTWQNSPIIFAETRLIKKQNSASGVDSTKDTFDWIP
jgi:hypothetical protein